MNSTFFVFLLLIFSAATLGGLVPLLVHEARQDSLKLLVSLGAGLLLGMAFVHMIPEASHLLPDSFGVWLLVGFLLLLVLERFIMVHACEEHGCDYHTVGIAAFTGLAVHGIIEGFALASSMLVSNLGPFVLIAIVSHKAPAGFALTSILRLSGKRPKQILAFVIGVALSGPLGMILAYFMMQSERLSQMAGVLLSLSAGTFLYIGACDLLPELHRSNTDKVRRLVLFLLGIAIAVFSTRLLGDGHPHGH